MNSIAFDRYLNNVNNLGTRQFRLLKDKISKIESQKIVAKTLETPQEKLNCPHCNFNEFYRWGKQSDLQRYKCKRCKKTFNSLTGTYLARLRRKGHWLDYAKCIKYGKTIRKSAAICKISKSTSFRWRHRFLKGTNFIVYNKLNGIIELNEVKQKRSFKGAVKIPEKFLNDRGNIWLLFGRDRDGKTINFIFNEWHPSKIAIKLNSIISKDSLFCSDDKEEYNELSSRLNLRHGKIDTKRGIYLYKDIVHIDNVKNYYEYYNLWMKRFKGVATKYLRNYLSWFRGLEHYKMNPNPKIILLRAKTKF